MDSNRHETELRQLLKQWPDLEPSAGFDQNVWRRVRNARVDEPLPGRFTGWFGVRPWRPALAWSAAVGMAIVIGAWGGIRSVPDPVKPPPTEVGFLAAGTLAGSYAQLITGSD